MPIEQLKIRGVRGINDEIAILFNGSSLIIHGDNGTGKSSIERALRWVLTGDEEPTNEVPYVSERSFRRHIMVALDFPRVAISTQSGISIIVTPGNVETDDEGYKYRKACAVGNPFLRRKELLAVLSAKPVDRFTYLESFLDIELADKTIVELTETVGKITQDANEISAKINSELMPINSAIPKEIRPAKPDIAAIKDFALGLAFKLNLLEEKKKDWDSLMTAAAQAKSLSTGDALVTKRMTLEKANDEITKYCDKYMSCLITNLNELEVVREELEKKTANVDSLLGLLEHAKKHLEIEEGAICPICGQDIDREKTIDSLSGRLSELAEYREINKTLKEIAGTWATKWVDFFSAGTAIVHALGKNKITDILPSAKAPHGLDLLTDAMGKSRDNLAAAFLIIDTVTLEKWIQAILDFAVPSIKSALDKLPKLENLAELGLLSAIVEELAKKREKVKLLETQHKILSQRNDYLGQLLDAMRRARQDVAKEILGSIAKTVEEYYLFMHPTDLTEEVTGPPIIKIQRHGKGTAFIEGKYKGKIVGDPGWVYSDGHLDTVGLCIFLALRRFRGDQAADPRLLVLDDVVLSIDLSHARRLVELLRKEFEDHQLILLTHNELFAHWCVDLMPGIKKLCIKRWSIETGPQIGDYETSFERLNKNMGTESAKVIAGDIMDFLDEWLAEARYAFALAVPARYGEKYTTREIWDQFAPTIKAMEKKLGVAIGETGALLEKLKDLPEIRNYLAAHENEFARQFPRSAIIEIAQNVIKLVESLYCFECKSFVRPVPNRHNPSILHCRKHHIQYIKAAATA